MRTFAFAAAALVVFAHLLPEAVAAVGFPALVVFGASLALPALLERLAHSRHGHGHLHGEHADDHAPGLEIGYLGLLLHNFGDGLGIGALPSAWARTEIALSVAAHTIPVVAIFVVAFASQRSTRAALVRAAFLAVAIAAGMLAASLVPESFTGALEPWITAAIAGVLLHVIAHDWPADPAPSPLSRALDLVAIAAAILLSLAQTESGVEAHAGAEVPARLAAAMARLALGIGPPLLAGLVASAVLQALLDALRPERRASTSRSSADEAAHGVALAAREPAAAPRALARADELRVGTGGVARAVAFATSVRGLGLETLLVSASMLGLRWSLVRLLGTMLLGLAAGWAAARAAERAPGVASAGDAGDAEATARGAPGGTEFAGDRAHRPTNFAVRFLATLDELVAHVGAWTIVGMLAACYVELALPAEGFDRSPLSTTIAWLVAAAAVASWLGAVAVTPLAAVLVHDGWPRAAALAALLLGPSIGLAGCRWVRDRFGRDTLRATIAAMVGVAVAWSLAAGRVGLLTRSGDPIVDQPSANAVATASVVALCVLLARSVWRSGLRNWLARLVESPAEGPAIRHAHAAAPGIHRHADGHGTSRHLHG